MLSVSLNLGVSAFMKFRMAMASLLPRTGFKVAYLPRLSIERWDLRTVEGGVGNDF